MQYIYHNQDRPTYRAGQLRMVLRHFTPRWLSWKDMMNAMSGYMQKLFRLALSVPFLHTALRPKNPNSFRSPRASLQNLRVNVFLNKKNNKTKKFPCFSATKEYVKHFQMLQYCILKDVRD